MWHMTLYPLISGIFMHTVEDSCLDSHTEYIKETYGAVPDGTSEVDKIHIDPGGMMILDGGKTEIILPDGMIFTINDEHILAAVTVYFSIDILDDAAERKKGSRDLDSGYTVRFADDDVIKVYLPHNILVMTTDTYMNLAGELEKLYLKGLNAYMDLASSLPDEFFIMGLGDILFTDDVGEA